MPNIASGGQATSPDWKAERTTPRDRDVVVVRDGGSPPRFAIGQHPAAGEILVSSREEACRLARGFARAEGLDAWYHWNGTYERLGSFRPRREP